MRTIKFRAWDKIREIMLDVVNVKDGFRELGGREITTSWLFDERNDNPYLAMQYTGLKDKNGKEIYEGDIVDVVIKTEYNIHNEEKQIVRATIVWDEAGKWTFKGKLKGMGFPYSLANYDYEVVGNIYENKNLCK